MSIMFAPKPEPSEWSLWKTKGKLAEEYEKYGKPCENTPRCPCNLKNIDGIFYYDPRLRVDTTMNREYYYFHQRLWCHRPYRKIDIW